MPKKPTSFVDKIRRDVITTGVVSQICKVAPRTVSKWVDRGELPGYHVPGSGRDRRIPRANLIRFMRKNHIPLGPLAVYETARAAFATPDRGLAESLRNKLDGRCELETYESMYELGGRINEDCPGVVILDWWCGPAECRSAINSMQKPDTAIIPPTIIAVFSDDGPAAAPQGVRYTFARPFDHDLLARTVRHCFDKELATWPS